MSYHIHADKRTYVYRIFDNTGRLIYVGSSHEPEARIAAHKQKQWWAPQIGKIRLKVYPNRQDALDAESAAIRDEHPRWNINHRSWGRSDWTADNYQDFITAMENATDFKTPYRAARIDKARRYLKAFADGYVSGMMTTPSVHDAVTSFRHPSVEAA